HVGKLAHVSIIERRIYFIEDTERCRLDEVNGKQECSGGKGLFTTGKLCQRTWTFSFWLRINFDTTFCDVLRIGKAQIAGIFFRKQCLEYSDKILANLLKSLFKLSIGSIFHLFDCCEQTFLCVHQVGLLFDDE